MRSKKEERRRSKGEEVGRVGEKGIKEGENT